MCGGLDFKHINSMLAKFDCAACFRASTAQATFPAAKWESFAVGAISESDGCVVGAWSDRGWTEL